MNLKAAEIIREPGGKPGSCSVQLYLLQLVVVVLGFEEFSKLSRPLRVLSSLLVVKVAGI